MSAKKILHVANRAERVLGKRYYSLPYKINNGFVRNGHNVLWFSDRDTAKTSTIIPARSFGRGKCNEKLTKVCENFKPEVIAFAHADLIYPETVSRIKEFLPDVRIFQYNIDGLWQSGNVESILSKIDVVDYTFVTTGGEALRQVSNEHSRACFMPNPVDSSIDIHKNWEKTDLDFDLFFVAQFSKWLEPQSMRAQTLRNFETNLPEARVFSSRAIWGDSFVSAIGQAKMALNFSQYTIGQTAGPGGNLYLYSSDRISQCMGNGLLTFSDGQCQMSDIYGADALVEVSEYDEFIDKFKYYLDHDTERKKIAKRGYDIAHSEFNERLVTQYFVETIFDINYSHQYIWPTDKY